MKVKIVNLSPWPVGGFTSVTRHAYKCLAATGVDVEVLRPNLDKDEKTSRLLSPVKDVTYRNVSVSTLLKECKDTMTLVTGVARTKDLRDPDTIPKLIDIGAKILVHSHLEHKQFDHIELLEGTGCGVSIRQSLVGVYSGVDQYLPHPYSARYTPLNRLTFMSKGIKSKRAGCLAMVVAHKNPDMILEANRLLPADKHIEFIGKENRMYTKFQLSKKYPEYELRNGGVKCDPAIACKPYQMMVDLSLFDVGNGGTQYVFLETIDGGAVCVIHRGWLKERGDMKEGVNCLAVESPEELARLVKTFSYPKQFEKVRKGGEKLLEQHGPQAFTEAVAGLFT